MLPSSGRRGFMAPMSEQTPAATRGRGASPTGCHLQGLLAPAAFEGSGRERRERNGGATFAAPFLSCANQATPSARPSNARSRLGSVRASRRLSSPLCRFTSFSVQLLLLVSRALFSTPDQTIHELPG